MGANSFTPAVVFFLGGGKSFLEPNRCVLCGEGGRTSAKSSGGVPFVAQTYKGLLPSVTVG